MSKGYMRPGQSKTKTGSVISVGSGMAWKCPKCGDQSKGKFDDPSEARDDLNRHNQEMHSNQDKGSSETWDKTVDRKLTAN